MLIITIMKTLSKSLALILVVCIFALFYCMQTPIIKEPFSTKELEDSCNGVNSLTERDTYPILDEDEDFTVSPQNITSENTILLGPKILI